MKHAVIAIRDDSGEWRALELVSCEPVESALRNGADRSVSETRARAETIFRRNRKLRELAVWFPVSRFGGISGEYLRRGIRPGRYSREYVD